MTGIGELLWGASSGLFYLAVWFLTAVAWWKLFEKAGKPGWAAIIPIYNLIVLLDIVGLNLLWIVAFFIPIVNMLAFLYLCHRLSLAFGRGPLFTVGLFFLNAIFTLILGLGDSRYRGASAASPS